MTLVFPLVFLVATAAGLWWMVRELKQIAILEEAGAWR